MFCASFPILWYNEKRGVKIAEIISDGRKECIEVNDGRCIKETEGSLICLHGDIKTTENLVDDDLGIRLEDGIKMIRKIEIYQYFESKNKDKDENNEEHTYRKDWAQDIVDSYSFHNPDFQGKNEQKSYKFITNKTFYCNDLKIGEYEINEEMRNSLKCETNMSLLSQENYIKYDELKKITTKNIEIQNNILYFCRHSYTKPRLGDIRVQFDYLKSPKNYTAVGIQRNFSLQPYFGKKSNEKYQNSFELKETNNGINDQLIEKKEEKIEEKKGIIRTVKDFMESLIKINWIFEGYIDLETCFKTKLKEEEKITWMLRLIGFLFMVFGVYLFFGPLLALFNWIPILGTLISFLFFIFSLSFGFSLSLIVISVAWFFYRPAVGLIMVGGSILLYILTLTLL